MPSTSPACSNPGIASSRSPSPWPPIGRRARARRSSSAGRAGSSAGSQLERLGEEPVGGLVGRERHRPVAGGQQRLACSLDQIGLVLDAGGPRERQRLLVVVGEQLGVVVGAAEPLDPLGRAPVLFRPRTRAGSGRRRRRATERAGRCTGCRRRLPSAVPARTKSFRSSARSSSSASCRLDAARQRSRRRARRPCRAPRPPGGASFSAAGARRAGRRSRPAPISGSSLRSFRVRRACGRTARRRADCRPPARAASACVLRELQPAGRAAPTISCVVSSSSSGCRARWWSRSPFRRPRPASLQQLGPRRPDDQQRRGAKEVDEVVQEVEQAVVGPVQVLEDEDERPALARRASRNRRQPRPSRDSGALCLPSLAEPDERAQLALEPACLRFLRRRAARPPAGAFVPPRPAGRSPGSRPPPSRSRRAPRT